jgi:hypothetical protein
MRYYVFILLLAIALALDVAFLALGFADPRPHAAMMELHIARAEALPTAVSSARAPTALPPTSTPPPSPTLAPSPTSAPPSPTAPPIPTATAAPTTTPEPEPRLLGSKSASFTPADRAVRANIRLALAHYSGALTHVVLAPGETFSFNATLGLRPQRLPWKYVRVKPTATSEGEPEAQLVQGGGVCDLASRYVMAARPFLPARAFRFVNHVRSNGVRIAGVPERDSVSIWAVGGGRGEHDLKITNTTSGWIEWVVDRHGEKITVTAQLWDRSPPGW